MTSAVAQIEANSSSTATLGSGSSGREAEDSKFMRALDLTSPACALISPPPHYLPHSAQNTPEIIPRCDQSIQSNSNLLPVNGGFRSLGGCKTRFLLAIYAAALTRYGSRQHAYR